MPPPISRYQVPAPVFGSMSATFHSRSSSAFVPLRSPRETNAAFAAAIALRAATASCVPTTCAGSDSGPTIMKSFHAILPAVDAIDIGDKFLVGLGIMHKDEIGIAAASDIEGLTGAEREHANRDD